MFSDGYGVTRGNPNLNLADFLGVGRRRCFRVFAGAFEKSGVQNVVF